MASVSGVDCHEEDDGAAAAMLTNQIVEWKSVA
jgi:hypothetical protein